MRATESYHTACPRAVASLQQSALFSASSLIGPCAHIITVRIDTPAGMGIRGTGDQDNSRGRLSHRGDLSFKSLRVHHNCRICKPLTRGAVAENDNRDSGRENTNRRASLVALGIVIGIRKSRIACSRAGPIACRSIRPRRLIERCQPSAALRCGRPTPHARSRHAA